MSKLSLSHHLSLALSSAKPGMVWDGRTKAVTAMSTSRSTGTEHLQVSPVGVNDFTLLIMLIPVNCYLNPVMVRDCRDEEE